MVKEHRHVAMALLIKKLKYHGLTYEQAMKDVRAYRAKIKAMGWPVKRIMSPITFFKNDLRRRVSLGEVPEEPARRFARQMNIPDDLAEEFMNLD